MVILLMVTCLANNSVAQQTQKTSLFGKVVDAENEEHLPGVHVVNKNQFKGTVSDIDGNFSITLYVGDSIFFTFVGYQPQYFIFDTANQWMVEDILVIALSPSVIELAPVNIFAYKTERDFKNAVIALQLPNETTPQLTVPGYYYGPPKPVNAGAGSPISFLVGKFGKQAKQEKRFKAAKKKLAYRKFIDTKYNKDLVSQITGLQALALEEFMDQCTLSDSFIENANEYDIIVAINDCFKEYNN